MGSDEEEIKMYFLNKKEKGWGMGGALRSKTCLFPEKSIPLPGRTSSLLRVTRNVMKGTLSFVTRSESSSSDSDWGKDTSFPYYLPIRVTAMT